MDWPFRLRCSNSSELHDALIVDIRAALLDKPAVPPGATRIVMSSGGCCNSFHNLVEYDFSFVEIALEKQKLSGQSNRMSATHSDVPARSLARNGRVLFWILSLCAIAFFVAMLLPVVFGPRKSRPTQAWANLRQIRVALANYCHANGALPYDPKGPEYALYVLSGDLTASRFDSHPHNKPNPEAHWDHDEKRLVDSDFEYINLPDIDFWPGPMIVLAEKPNEAYQTVSLLRCDGSTTRCKATSGSSRDLLGNWVSWDNFLVKGHDLFREWEAVPLPRMAGGYSASTSKAAEGSIWNTRMVHRAFGRIDVYYEYQRGELVRRRFDSPEGKITDTVTTDEFGRIVAFSREPKEWKAFWPVPLERD